jgi:hypothetical protein
MIQTHGTLRWPCSAWRHLLSAFLFAQQAGVDPNPPNPAVDVRNQGGLLDVALDPQ